MDNTLTHILAATEARPTGSEKWLGHCPAHGSKRHRDLSIKLTSERILLHCFAACETEAICRSLGLELRDLFTDALDTDPRRRRAAAQLRAQRQLELDDEARIQGRRIDALREADYHIRSRQGLDISQWTDRQLDDELNLLADAYALLASEECHGS